MFKLFSYYRTNSIVLQGGIWWIFKHCILYPGVLIGIYILLKYLQLDVKRLNSGSLKDMVNTIAIVSGFLLTGLSIILSNTSLSESQKPKIQEKYNDYIIAYGDGDIKKRLARFKLSLLLDTIFLITVCIILALIITILKTNFWVKYIIIYLLGFLSINLLTLIKQILIYLNIIEFN